MPALHFEKTIDFIESFPPPISIPPVHIFLFSPIFPVRVIQKIEPIRGHFYGGLDSIRPGKLAAVEMPGTDFGTTAVGEACRENERGTLLQPAN
jgi:hypothetical protein